MKRNIKLQTVSAWSIALTSIVAVLCLAISCSATRKFHALLTATDQYILCEDAAKQLQSRTPAPAFSRTQTPRCITRKNTASTGAAFIETWKTPAIPALVGTAGVLFSMECACGGDSVPYGFSR